MSESTLRRTRPDSGTPQLQSHSRLISILLALVLVAIITLSAGMGYMEIAWLDVVRVVCGSLTGSPSLTVGLDELTRVIVMDVRLPRILTAASVGGGLAMCGVVFQGILLNPLADPYTLGVSAGAAFGAALVGRLGVSQKREKNSRPAHVARAMAPAARSMEPRPRHRPSSTSRRC